MAVQYIISPALGQSVGFYGKTSHMAPATESLTPVRKPTKGLSGLLRPFIERAQISRMHGVLSAMTNDQLREIGITRKDIPQHARHLILAAHDTK